MQLENNFKVPCAPAEAWEILIDVERIVPCLPGAILIEVIDEVSYKGKVDVKLGPVKLTFHGDVRFVERDPKKYYAIIEAEGREARGRGSAQASIKFKLDDADYGSNVSVMTDLNLIGPVAQYGRSQGIVEAVSEELINQFSSCLEQKVIRGNNVKQSLEKSVSVSGIIVLFRSLKRWIYNILNVGPSR